MSIKLAAWAIIGLSTLPAQNVDALFRPKQMREWNDRANDGRCIIRVMVDDEVDVELSGDQVRVRVLKGGAGRDDGSECTQPLPIGGFSRFAFRGIDGRGEVRLVQEPRPGNNYVAIVAIKDSRKGTEGYTYELSWNTDGSAFWRPGAVPATSGSGGGFLPSLGSPAPQPQPQRITSINETRGGTGQIRLGDRSDQVSRVRLNLKPDGAFEIQIYSSVVTSLSGRWVSNQGGADLDIAGFGLDNAAGRGRVTVGSDGRATKVELAGRTAQTATDFSVNFDAAAGNTRTGGGILPNLNPR